jgi:hypothetical protein
VAARALGPAAGRANEADLASVVYLRTRLHAPAAQAVVFALGSDDGLKVWLNGELVHANNAGCGLTFRVLGENGQNAPGVRLEPR